MNVGEKIRLDLGQDELCDLLVDLGKTPNEVASALREAKIQGKKDNCVFCPLAVYLSRKLPGLTPKVGTNSCWVLNSNNETIQVLLPCAAEAFVRRMDAGEYPDLDIDYKEEQAGVFQGENI